MKIQSKGKAEFKMVVRNPDGTIKHTQTQTLTGKAFEQLKKRFKET